MSDVLSNTDDRWARRLVVLLLLGLMVALPVAWVSSQYLDNEVSSALSYNARDGWCEAGVYPGLGRHCFGDYSSQALTAQHDFGLGARDFTKGPYTGDASAAYNSLYPPVSQFPNVAASALLLAGADPVVVFDLYIGLLILALLIPALWVAWRWRPSPFLLLPIIMIGIAALPVLAAADRGNSAGFVVPLLLAFTLFLGREPAWMAPSMAVGAGLVRPQFILVAIALAAIGRIRHALAAVVAFGVITIASFALTAAGLTASLPSWWHNVTTFQGGSGDLTSRSPANISSARSVVSLGLWLGNAPGVIGSFGHWIAGQAFQHPVVPGVLLAIVTLTVLYFTRRTTPRSVVVVLTLAVAATFGATAPPYYLAFTVVLAALVIVPAAGARREDGLLEDDAPWFWGWPLLAVVALSIAPIALSGDTAPGSQVIRNTLLLEDIGKVWLLLIVGGLVWAVARARRGRGRLTPAPPPRVP